MVLQPKASIIKKSAMSAAEETPATGTSINNTL
jgi:hypothetical protein